MSRECFQLLVVIIRMMVTMPQSTVTMPLLWVLQLGVVATAADQPALVAAMVAQKEV